MRQLLLLWRTMDFKDVRGTFPAFLELALPIILAAHGQSAALGNAYLTAFRAAEGVPGEADSVPVPLLPTEQVATSLLVTGPIAVLTGVRAGHDEATAMQNALTQTLGAGSRLALTGGRDTLMGSSDRYLVGYARVTSHKTCHFCAMLASRGPVYNKQTASFDAHDNCHCQPEPVYSEGDGTYKNPGRADEFRKLYDESTAGLSSAESLPAFRRAFNGQAA